MNFEEAKEKAINCGKTIIKIQENNEYWLFDIKLPNKDSFEYENDSIYISKKDGTVIPMHLCLIEIQELDARF